MIEKLTVEMLRSRLTHFADETQIVLARQDDRPGEVDVSAWNGHELVRIWTFILGNEREVPLACEKELPWAGEWPEMLNDSDER